MKAKEYYKFIFDCNDKEQVEPTLQKIFDGLTAELKTLISARGGMMDSPKYRNIVAACLRETNMKWQYIANTFNKDAKSGSISENNPFLGGEFTQDAFKAYFVKMNPEFSFLFDVKKYEKWIQKENARREQAAEFAKNVFEKEVHPYIVKPLNEITKENIIGEILGILGALGHYRDIGFPLRVIEPLAYRVSLLRWWQSNGINYDDISEFEKDKKAWAQAHIC